MSDRCYKSGSKQLGVDFRRLTGAIVEAKAVAPLGLVDRRFNLSQVAVGKALHFID